MLRAVALLGLMAQVVGPSTAVNPEIEAMLVRSLPRPDPKAKASRFEGRVVAEWLPDGRYMQLQEDFSYVDKNKIRWTAPKGSKVDGASIPQWAWTWIGGPFEEAYRNASVIHDVACDTHMGTWERAHEMFYEAMLVSKVPVAKAKVMYAAVYYWGPRWEIFKSKGDKAKTRPGYRATATVEPPAAPDPDALKATIERIEVAEASGHGLSLEQLRKLAPPRK